MLFRSRDACLRTVSRVATGPAQNNAAPMRSYVTESRPDKAQVQAETAIRLDKKEFEKAGLAMSGQNGSDVHVSPMAGKTSPSSC